MHLSHDKESECLQPMARPVMAYEGSEMDNISALVSYASLQNQN